MFELVEEYKDCVLLRKKTRRTGNNSYKYMVRDNEGDILRMCYTAGSIPTEFAEFAASYSLAEIRKIKMENELQWRKEFVKA